MRTTSMRELYQGLTTAFAKLCASDEESRRNEAARLAV
jgi:hypothetical protein